MDFEYAQARMQARHGARPDEALWQRLGGQSGLAAYLAAARATSLAGWVSGIGERADSHEIELALRQRWREAVAELARWMPREWQAAVRWSAGLVDLPARAWLSSPSPGFSGIDPAAPDGLSMAGGEPWRWMAKEAALAAAGAPPSGQRSSLDAWQQDWRRRWPDGAEERGDEAGGSEALRRLAAAVAAHLAAFPQLPPAGAWEARRALGHEAARCFRRHACAPAAAFAWLLLLALDLERLRAELVLRALGMEAAS